MNLLQEEKALLDKLNAAPKSTTNEEAKIINKTLYDLVHKKIKKFKLILDDSKDFYLEFSSLSRVVKINLPNIKRHIKSRTFYSSELTGFQKIGFEMINSNKLSMSINNEGEKTYEQIKFILVKIVFNILYYNEYTNKSYIEF